MKDDDDRRIPSNQKVIDAVNKAVELHDKHVAELHILDGTQVLLNIKEHNKMKSDVSESTGILRRMERQLLSVTDTVYGEAVHNIDGVIERTGGLENRMDKVEKAAKVERLKMTDRVALYTAALGSVTAMIIALVASI